MAKTLDFDPRKNPKNFIINGSMILSQRGTSFAAIANGAYHLDRFRYDKVGAMVHTVTQDTDVPTLAQAGYLFQNSLRVNLTTPDTSIAAGDYLHIGQRIEGYNWANLAQKPFTLSFWVKATLPGTYCVAFQNSAGDRSYVAEYTVNTTNTWEYKAITVSASPSAGTWNYTNGIGLIVAWTLAAGTTFQTTANAWQTGSFIATANQVNGVNTGATDFRITGVMLNEGADALPFRTYGESIGDELYASQRYCEVISGLSAGQNLGNGAYTTTTVGTIMVPFATTKRAFPAVTFVNVTSFRMNNASANNRVISVNSIQSTLNVSSMLLNGSAQTNGAAISGFDCDNLNGAGAIIISAEL